MTAGGPALSRVQVTGSSHGQQKMTLPAWLTHSQSRTQRSLLQQGQDLNRATGLREARESPVATEQVRGAQASAGLSHVPHPPCFCRSGGLLGLWCLPTAGVIRAGTQSPPPTHGFHMLGAVITPTTTSQEDWMWPQHPSSSRVLPGKQQGGSVTYAWSGTGCRACWEAIPRPQLSPPADSLRGKWCR